MEVIPEPDTERIRPPESAISRRPSVVRKRPVGNDRTADVAGAPSPTPPPANSWTTLLDGAVELPLAEWKAVAFVVLPLGVAAKLSIAKSEPTEQKAKASKLGGLKRPD